MGPKKRSGRGVGRPPKRKPAAKLKKKKSRG